MGTMATDADVSQQLKIFDMLFGKTPRSIGVLEYADVYELFVQSPRVFFITCVSKAR